LAEASSTVDRLRAEARGPRYDRHMMFETRYRTFAAIQRIGSLILSGMTEEERIAVGRRAPPRAPRPESGRGGQPAALTA
jgi:hypothetical protein